MDRKVRGIVFSIKQLNFKFLLVGLAFVVVSIETISKYTLDFKPQQPPSILDVQSMSETHEYEYEYEYEYDVLRATTNDTLFVASCTTSDVWRLSNRKRSETAIFHRLRSSNVGFPCPNQPKCTNLNLPRIALLSYPRSGNTWARHFLEQLTGLPTGSVYDNTALKSRFLCEGHTRGVVVIKTHHTASKRLFDKSIVILRNPYKSLASYHQYKRHRSDLLLNDKFNVSSKLWDSFIKREIQNWKRFVQGGMDNSLPKLILFYEDLTFNLYREILRIAQFLNADNVRDFAFCCALKKQEGSFHKKSNGQDIVDLYSPDQRNLVNKVLNDVAGSTRDMNPEVANYLSNYKT